MKMKTYLMAPAMAAALLLAACNNDDDMGVDLSKPISLSFAPASMDGQTTRATIGIAGASFEKDDRVGLYMDGTGYANVLYTCQGTTGWTTSGLLYWPNAGSYTFRAYYPYMETVTDAVSLPADQSTAEAFTRADRMWASATRAATNGTISLTLDHRMSLIKLDVEDGEAISLDEIKDMTPAILGAMPSEGTWDLQTGAISFPTNGKTISGLYINDPENMYIGLFSKLSDKATVTNLTIGPDSYICGWGYVGAIAGKSCGAITNCNNHARVSGISNVGGITGATDYGATALSGCLNTGAISAEKGQAGGIVGNAIYLKQIERCLNSGSVTITNPEETTGQAGGIAGYSSVAITLCGNTGILHDMTATEDKAMAGGIVGRTYGSASAPATITQCYNSGTVITATQTNCGPIAGIQQDKADITADCYYDTQAMPGLEPAEGLTGLPTASIVDAANLSGLNAEEWSFGPDRYPIPAHMAENAGAQLAAAALFLADNDDYTRVTGNFELTATDGLEWWTGSSLTLNIDGTTVTINRQSEDKQCELTAELNGIEKTFRIVVAKEDGSGIAAKAAARPTVTAIDRTIEINGAENAVIAIFDASGRNIRTISRAAACERVNIGQSGVFIVRILDGKDAEAVKVIL